jgi:WhiB family transcriptional regulator, redox-sensing transcriptional regulator
MARVMGQLQPISEAWEWQMHGRCRDRASSQFFHPDDDLGRISRRLREEAAKRLCAGCPVRKQCATHALSVNEEYGVWGGFSENDRATLREMGWRDALDRRRLIDVDRLDERLAKVAVRKQRDRERRLRADAERERSGHVAGERGHSSSGPSQRQRAVAGAA